MLLIRLSHLNKLSLVFLASFLGQIFFPSISAAITLGPNQPEFSSFTPAESDENVNLFTGDFSYNIPLFDVDGYPVNIAYSDNISMEQEASWVGLGWNINVGSLSRMVRGIPDDFSGDIVNSELNLKPDITKGIRVGGDISGSVSAFLHSASVGGGIGLGAFKSTYNGPGIEVSINAFYQLANPVGSIGHSLGVNYNTQKGLTGNISKSLSYNSGFDPFFTMGGGSETIINGYNSRQGKQESVRVVGKREGLTILGSGGMTGDYSIVSLPSASPTYIPQAPFSTFGIANATDQAFNLNVALGIGLNLGATISSTKYTDERKPIGISKASKSYGYIYSADRGKGLNNISDYNRQFDGAYTENIPNVPVPNSTYDVLLAKGQGIYSVFRPYRNDVGTLGDQLNFDLGTSITSISRHGIAADPLAVAALLTGQISSLNIISYSNQDGSEFGMSNVQNSKLQIPSIENAFKYSKTEKNSLHEPVYFQKMGESTSSNDGYYESYLGDNPIYFKTEISGSGIASMGLIAKNGGTTAVIPSSSKNENNNGRQPRNEHFSFLTAEEATAYGLEKKLRSYDVGTSNFVETSRTSGGVPLKHISEVSVAKEDGTRYVYGIPVYNNRQTEVTFATSNLPNNNDLVQYDNTHISSTNDDGKDGFYQRTSMGKYATDYLLTAVVSNDYVDITGDGPTVDDIGNYTKFNYSRVLQAYGWRMPCSTAAGAGVRVASFSEGFKTDAEDNKASFIAGSRDVWYLHSIESKNYIAKFILDPQSRSDGFGMDEDGNHQPNEKLKSLKEIQLFTRESLREISPDPLKVIEFEYDYSLCKNTPNGGGAGKLTLKKISFRGGKSKKGRLSPFIFRYSTYNPDYGYNITDRWGNYKPTNSNNECGLGPASVKDFPYAEQNYPLAAQYASAWKLTEIRTPSGSEMKVAYESDDYAYVQDQRAMGMFRVLGFSNAETTPPSSTLYSSDKEFSQFTVMWVKIPGVENAESVKRVTSGIKNVFCKSLVNLKGNESEFVPSFLEVNNVLFHNTDTIKVLVKQVQLEEDHISEGYINPVAATAFQFMRLNTPSLIWPSVDLDGNILNSLSSIQQSLSTDLETLVSKKLHKVLKKNGFCKSFVPCSSWARFYYPSGRKLGGGSRVKSIELSDGWIAEGSDGKASYITEYSYTQNEGITGASSGVASYEPLIGQEENSLKNPFFYKVQNLKFPDDHHYQWGPLGEDHFPSPVVGYSAVQVKRGGVPYNTGYETYEFYTAKEFPTIVRSTEIDRQPVRFVPTSSQQKAGIAFTFTYLSQNQGFVIERNNMHGQFKGHSVVDGNGKVIQWIRVKYKTRANKSRSLETQVAVINKSGVVSTRNLGKKIDIIPKLNFNGSHAMSNQVVTTTTAGLFVASKAVDNYTMEDENRYFSTAITKVIETTGLLDETTVSKDGNVVKQKVLAYDEGTGIPVLISVTNEFEAPIYTFNYPAHWGYPRMSGSYKNHGAIFDLTVGDNGSCSFQGAANFFSESDELIDNNGSKLWVSQVNPDGLVLIKGNGYNADQGVYTGAKIIKSGYKNQLNQFMGTVVSLENPLLTSELSFAKVLNSSATEFTDRKSLFCNWTPPATTTYTVSSPEGNQLTLIVPTFTSTTCGGSGDGNWFRNGYRGAFNVIRSFNLNQGIQNTSPVGFTNIATDGFASSFTPFWALSSNVWKATPSPMWLKTWEASIYGRNGELLESQDVQGIYSCSLFGYINGTAQQSVASIENSRQYQSCFDSFEDYLFGIQECQPRHFSWKEAVPSSAIDKSFFHTGKSSLKISGQSHYTTAVPIHICSNSITDPSGGLKVSDPNTPVAGPDNCNCKGKFALEAGKKYVVSCWVKQAAHPVNDYYDKLRIGVHLIDNAGTAIKNLWFSPKLLSPIIDGWQRVEGIIDLAGVSSSSINDGVGLITLRNSNSSFTGYFDDFRIHPFTAAMTSFVYDPLTLKPMAVLDAQNYATFYKYNEDGDLVRVEKETPKGKKTIQEKYVVLPKNFVQQ